MVSIVAADAAQPAALLCMSSAPCERGSSPAHLQSHGQAFRLQSRGKASGVPDGSAEVSLSASIGTQRQGATAGDCKLAVDCERQDEQSDHVACKSPRLRTVSQVALRRSTSAQSMTVRGNASGASIRIWLPADTPVVPLGRSRMGCSRQLCLAAVHTMAFAPCISTAVANTWRYSVNGRAQHRVVTRC